MRGLKEMRRDESHAARARNGRNNGGSFFTLGGPRFPCIHPAVFHMMFFW